MQKVAISIYEGILCVLEIPNLSFYSIVYPCHSVRFILWTMIWHGIQRHGFDLFMKRKLKTSKNLINYEASLFFPPQSVSKNMKSEMEISPDNEVLDLFSKETPKTPTACQGETEEHFTNLDKVWRKMPLLKCTFPSFRNINLWFLHLVFPPIRPLYCSCPC